MIITAITSSNTNGKEFYTNGNKFTNIIVKKLQSNIKMCVILSPKKAVRSPIIPYAYQATSGVQSTERPLMSLMSSPSTSYAQQQSAIVGPMAIQQQNSSTFPNNLCTNPESTPAHIVCHLTHLTLHIC